MKTKLIMGAIALIASVGVVSADPWNKKTKLDVRETILIPGKELPPGKYVMKLVDSLSNRHIVQIMNEREDKVEATILAIPNYRLKLTDGTDLRFWETPAGMPPALRAWFYPGDNFGQEFAYPKDVATRIASVNKTKVTYYETHDTATLKTTDHDVDTSSEKAEAVLPPTPEESTVSEQAAIEADKAPVPEGEPDMPARDESAEVATPSPYSPDEEPTLMAQNRPATPPADPAPEQLPQTASPIWALGLLGGTFLTAGLALRGLRHG